MGLSQRDDLWFQDASGVLGSGEQGDEFGASVAVGDLDGDGVDDLLVGVPGEDKRFYGSEAAPTGAWHSRGGVHLLYGARGAGLSSSGDIFFQGHNQSGVHRYGEVIVVCDTDGDGHDEVLVSYETDSRADAQLQSHDFSTGVSWAVDVGISGARSRLLSASGGPDFAAFGTY